MDNNGGKWDKNFVVALLSLIVSCILGGLALMFTVATPELRKCFGLDVVEITIKLHTPHENQPQFIKEANARLSASFHDEYKTASITIAPAGKQAVVRPVLNGYTEEFTSSTGTFLVHVLNIDWNSRTITVQVSRKI